ncbi:unnamed protein product [Alopecurus aequalis]
MSFAGASLIHDGQLWTPAPAIQDVGAASGYHLLVVEGYSRTKADILTGKYIMSSCFRVGGYLWYLKYYPNGWPGYSDFMSASLILAQDVASTVKAKRDVFENSEHLKDDSFTIRCDVVVINDVDAKGTSSPFVTVPLPDMQHHFTYLLMAKEGTDVTFKMKEGTTTAGTIVVEDMEPQVFRSMLVFIYGDSEPELEKKDDEAVMWQHLLAVADRYDLQRLKLMCEDKLCRCDVAVINDDAKVRSAASPFVSVPPPDMQRHFTDLLMAKEGTDVTLKVGNETFAAHRCVLAARSRVFKAELFGPMKEGTTTAGAILVEDMDARVFRALLAFIYNDSEPELGKEDDEAVMWQHLLAAADRYDLQRLKLMCEDKLCGFIDVNTTTTILALAELYCCDGLKTACYEFLGAPANLKAVAGTDGFDHLVSSYPSVMKELIAMLAP